MNLSKEMALRLHRMMWSDMQKELGDNPSGDARNKFKTDWIQRMFPDEYIRNHCFLCEYAGNAGCSECPIEWGNVQASKARYKWLALCTGTNTDYLSSPISEILALPEKGKESIPVSEEDYITNYDDHYARRIIANCSGLPQWYSIPRHIAAIKEKAVEDYFKNNPGSKLVTMDVDEAFKQYAREQKAPILKKLAERSGLEVSEPVEKHLDEIEKWASDCRASKELEHFKKWLSAYSKLPAAKEVHDHVSAIIDKSYDRGYDRGMKDLLEAMKERVEG